MKETKNVQTPSKRDIEPGHPDYKPGNTATPKQEVKDEDARAELAHELVHEKKQPKDDNDEAGNKVVNEEEQDQVVNDDEAATETSTQPPKMSDKPKQPVNEQERN